MNASLSLFGNPFAQLLDPSVLVKACSESKALRTLEAKVYRPMDKPRLVANQAAAAYDYAIDAGLPAQHLLKPAKEENEGCVYVDTSDMPEVLYAGNLVAVPEPALVG